MFFFSNALRLSKRTFRSSPSFMRKVYTMELHGTKDHPALAWASSCELCGLMGRIFVSSALFAHCICRKISVFKMHFKSQLTRCRASSFVPDRYNSLYSLLMILKESTA